MHLGASSFWNKHCEFDIIKSKFLSGDFSKSEEELYNLITFDNILLMRCGILRWSNNFSSCHAYVSMNARTSSSSQCLLVCYSAFSIPNLSHLKWRAFIYPTKWKKNKLSFLRNELSFDLSVVMKSSWSFVWPLMKLTFLGLFAVFVCLRGP